MKTTLILSGMTAVLAGALLSACGQQSSAPASNALPTNSSLPQPVPQQAQPNTMPPQSNSGQPQSAYNAEPSTNSRPAAYRKRAPQQVVSVYQDPPIEQPPPVQVNWAPPPMLVEEPPPPPSPDAAWIGGYWVWQGNWVWAHGRWAQPPRPGYMWHNPYYEHRNGAVVFINAFWGAPGVAFVAPPPGIHIDIGVPLPGIEPGPPPEGPDGVFVPPPPGSNFGLIVPAPIGTAPAVVTSAPPIIHEGMHITTNNITNNTATINNIRNVTNTTNVTNLTVVAPASATANGQAVHAVVPAQAHLAAAMHPMVRAMAPLPVSTRPIPAYMPGHAPAALPPPQTVRAEVPPGLVHPLARTGPQHPVTPPDEPQRQQHEQPKPPEHQPAELGRHEHQRPEPPDGQIPPPPQSVKPIPYKPAESSPATHLQPILPRDPHQPVAQPRDEPKPPQSGSKPEELKPNEKKDDKKEGRGQ
ncbi:MAG TPA: hypothetical protein VF472_01980 [Burkholderiaceae bacterium]